MMTIDGLIAVQRAELTNFTKDGQEIVILNINLGFVSFAAAATALAALGAAVNAQPATEPAAKPAKAVAAAVAATKEAAAPAAAAKPAPAVPKAAPAAPKPPAAAAAAAPKAAPAVAPKPPAAAPKTVPPAPPAVVQKAAAAVAASGGPRVPPKPPAAPKPAPEPEPAAEEVPALELTEFQAAALGAFNELDAAKIAKGDNPLNFKDVMLWLIAAYGGEGDAFDAAAVNAEAITLDVQALRTAVPAIDRVPEADLANRILRAIESLLTQRAAS